MRFSTWVVVKEKFRLLNEALNSSGIMSELYGPASRPLSAYDAVLHFSLNGGVEHIISAVSNSKIPLILWPNLWFINEPAQQDLERFSWLLNHFQAVVFRSQAEENHFRKYLNLDGKDVIRVSSLISPKFQRKNVTDVFRESYGLQSYDIWTGIIEPQKNQLAAVRAFNGLDIDLVISGEVRDQAYFDECKRQAGPNIKFIPAMPFGSDLHLSALSHSRMVIELPLDFRFIAIEAAALGCPLLLSRSEWTEELLGPNCIQVDPCDESEIRFVISTNIVTDNGEKARIPYQNMEDLISSLTRYINDLNA